MSSGHISIRRVTKQDIPDIVMLQREFDVYLGRLSGQPRKSLSVRQRRSRLHRDGFGSNAAFKGFIARKQGRAVGYILYHQGYDPDEMQGRVIYVIDLFVSQDDRRSGIGTLLMKEVARSCKRIGGISIYSGVWLKNRAAIMFYKKIGAKWVKEVPFMYWNPKNWRI